MPDPKRKPATPLRTPKPKKTLGLSVPPPIRMPHEELIFARSPEQTNIRTEPSITSPTSIPSQTRYPSSTSQPSVSGDIVRSRDSIAPTRDFTKVANSITRTAVPAGLFKGKSKQLYDCLYSLSRGAIVPSMTVRISRPKLMALAGIGARVTIDANINHLSNVGLIEVRSIAGEHQGNEYTVYLPEETTPRTTSQTSIPSLTSQPRSTYNQDRLVGVETSQTRYSLTETSSDTYGPRKTFLNTDDDDTHTLDEFTEILIEGGRQLVGGKLPTTEQERQRWKDCACVLVDELKDAAEKADAISSVPAFFATHLRRRFKKGERFKKQRPNQSTEPAARPTESAEQNAKSRFTLEECRQYAEHLQKSGQGITNPGGYATTIYRTGEADALIGSYKDQISKPEALDVSNCPDCKGSGFWYPKGIDSGVVKCKHARLKPGGAGED